MSTSLCISHASVKGKVSAGPTHDQSFGGHEITIGSTNCHTQEHEVTVCSQCSLDRWPNLVELITSHDGPASIAIYIPARKGTTEADEAEGFIKGRLATLRLSSERANKKNIVISHLYANHRAKEGASLLKGGLSSSSVDTASSGDDGPSDPYLRGYPINALRNLAIVAAPSNRVFLVDGDFIPSMGLAGDAERLLNDYAGGNEEGGHDGKIALVVPAFEMKEGTEDLPIPSNKKELRKLWASGKIEPFHCGKWAPLEESIDYGAWMEMGSNDHEPELHQARYHEYWEPVCIMERSILYDAEFRGYGLNKVQHSYHLARLGYRFMVLREHFVVTRPHVKSISYQALGQVPRPDEKRALDQKAMVEGLYQAFKARLLLQQEG